MNAAAFCRWQAGAKPATDSGMNTYAGLVFALLILLLILGGGVLIWHLSATAEFSRTASPPPAATSAPAPAK